MKITKVFLFLFCTTILSRTVLACSLAEGTNPNLLEERQDEVWNILGISLLFLISTFFLYFMRNQKGAIVSLIGLLAFGYSALKSNVYRGDCGSSAMFFAQTSILITFVCFMFQLITFIFFRKKPLAELP